MRYGFVLLSLIAVWGVAIILSRLTLSTDDRLILYFSMIILTVGLFLIGFTAKKA